MHPDPWAIDEAALAQTGRRLGANRLARAFHEGWYLLADAAHRRAWDALLAAAGDHALLGWRRYHDPAAASWSRAAALLRAACAAPGVAHLGAVCAYRQDEGGPIRLEPAVLLGGVSRRWLRAVATAVHQKHVYHRTGGVWRLWAADDRVDGGRRAYRVCAAAPPRAMTVTAALAEA